MSKFGYIWRFKLVRSIAFLVFMFLLALVLSAVMQWSEAYTMDCLTDYECEVLYANGVN